MNSLVLWPILIPFLAAACALVVRRRPLFQSTLGVIGATGLLIASILLLTTVWRDGIQVLQVGDWPAPFGITLVADLLSATMVVLTGVTGFAVSIYSLVSTNPRHEAFGYYPLLLILLMGVCGAFLTGDIFNLYVWFEVMLIASFVLLTLGGERAQIEGGFKYVTINLFSSTLFLTALGILYGLTGTLNMAALAQGVRTAPYPGLILTASMLFLIAFGIKAAVFPLFFWLPASYHTPPAAISAIFAGLLTKVGVYSLLRMFTLIFVQDVGYTHAIILIAAGLTMVSGVLGAVAQNEFRRILSFLVVSHIGFAIMGLGLFTQRGIAGSVFYVIEDIVVLTALFLVSGIVRRLGGSYDLKRLGGLYTGAPLVALLFFIPALSLSGIPPLSGFFAKLVLLQAALAAEQYLIVATALGASVLTLFTVTKLWAEVFWKPAPQLDHTPAAAGRAMQKQAIPKTMLLPIAGLVMLIVLIGVGAEPVFALATRAAEQLLDPTEYIGRVLGSGDTVTR
jgi:multicomponent Na+:H+ antiporter subunit D